MENFDTDANPTKHEELTKIIRWAAGLGDEAESQSLELKSQLSFEPKNGLRSRSFAKIIKFILAMSNRDEYKAAKAFQGYGVMLIGVGKDGIVGNDSELPEEHEFREHAKAYFGPTVPKFEFYPVNIEDKKVLAVVVDPPHNGQPIYICSKNFNPQAETDEKGNKKKVQDTLLDGAVYYRQSSSTKIATSDQLRELFERYKGGNVSLAFTNFGAITSYSFDRELEEDYWKDLARDAINELRNKSKQRGIGLISSTVGIGSTYKTINEQIEEIGNWRSRLNSCRIRLMEHVAPVVYFHLENTGSVNLSNVKIELTFPVEVSVYAARERFDSSLSEINPIEIDEKKAALESFPYRVPLNAVISGSEVCGNLEKVFWNIDQIAPGEIVTSFSDRAILLTENLTSSVPLEVSYRITCSGLSTPVVGKVLFDVFQVGHPYESLLAYRRQMRLG